MRYIFSVNGKRQDGFYSTEAAAHEAAIAYLKEHTIPFEVASSLQIVRPGTRVGDEVLALVDVSYFTASERAFRHDRFGIETMRDTYRYLGFESISAALDHALQQITALVDAEHAKDNRPIIR